MANTYREVKQTTVRDDDLVPAPVVERRPNVAARVVSLIGGILLAILGMRFVLSLLGANRSNAFADFIYTISYPFVAPFFGLFNYDPQFGVSRFEFETLIAMLFWGFLIWIIIRIVTIGDND